MKSILKSKVFWVATVQGVAGVWVVLETSMPGVGWVMIGKTVLDVLLRIVTNLPVSFSGKK